MSHDTITPIRPRGLLRCLIIYTYRHTADSTLAYSTQRREEIEKAKRQGEIGRGKIRNFKIRNMSRQQRTCTEAERHTDRYRHRQTDIERMGRLTAKRSE